MSVRSFVDDHSSTQERSSTCFHEVNKYVPVPTTAEAKDKSNYFLDRAHIDVSITFQDLMIVVTIYVLFGNELRMLCFDKSADVTFEVLSTISLFLFTVELLLNMFAKSTVVKNPKKMLGFEFKGYVQSLFFGLDLLAVLSMFPDIRWIGLDIFGGSSDVGQIGKLGRVARMVRLVRLAKLYKASANRAERKQRQLELLEMAKAGMITLEEYTNKLQEADEEKQSRVGAVLSNRTTQRVIVLGLTMLCVVPLLETSERVLGPLEATEILQSFNLDAASNPRALATATYEMYQQYAYYPADYLPEGKYLVYLEIEPMNQAVAPYCPHYENRTNSVVCVNEADILDGLRRSYPDEVEVVEKGPMTCSNGKECRVLAKFSRKAALDSDAFYDLLTTLFVACLLLLTVQVFQSLSDRLVLTPIQSMVDLVEGVAEDPSREFEISGQGGNYETHHIESAIQKITSLLRVGFGIAGAEIIRENLQQTGNDGGSEEPLDLLSAGKRIYAAFGFCDIHEFDHVTDVLAVGIMDFVNNVARVVHEHVDTWNGQCNKNLGNSFLVLWRVPPAATAGNQNVDVTRLPSMRVIADKALIAFVKVALDINRDQTLLDYREREDMILEGHPFHVGMGFGLHIGWAIEGPVGSLQKVDATYLSPHVNMTARLETASRQYGVPLLMSEIFFRCLSEKAKEQCRKLDRVSVKGSVQSIDIYTFDGHADAKLPRKRRTMLEQESSRLYDPDNNNGYWITDDDFRAFKAHFPPDLHAMHSNGISCYLRGDWDAAREKLQSVDDTLVQGGFGGDGPSRTILSFMGRHNFKAPPDWDEKKGRALTSK